MPRGGNRRGYYNSPQNDIETAAKKIRVFAFPIPAVHPTVYATVSKMTQYAKEKEIDGCSVAEQGEKQQISKVDEVEVDKCDNDCGSEPSTQQIPSSAVTGSKSMDCTDSRSDAVSDLKDIDDGKFNIDVDEVKEEDSSEDEDEAPISRVKLESIKKEEDKLKDEIKNDIEKMKVCFAKFYSKCD